MNGAPCSLSSQVECCQSMREVNKALREQRIKDRGGFEMLPLWTRRRIVLLLGAITLVIILLGGNVHQAHAQQTKLGPISIQQVWTSDTNQTSKTTFAPVDKINYHGDFDNTTGGPLQVNVQLEVISNNNSWGSGFSYHNSFSMQAPSGLTRLYTPATVPPTAVTGSYSIRISVAPSNSASPSNDGDWGEGDFTIFSSTNVNDLNKRIQVLQNGALCAGDIVSFGSDELLLASVQTGVSAEGFFQDEQTGNKYWGYVKLVPGASCVAAIMELRAQ
jgi:hypothetical protein